MTWTTPQDIRERWIGDDAPTNDQLLRALITDAEAVILSTYPGIQGRVDSGKLNPTLITFVTSRMVTRVLRNPENASYMSQTTGPFTSAVNRAEVDLWMTPDEVQMLSPIVPNKAFSVDLAPHSSTGVSQLIMTGNGYIEGAPFQPAVHGFGCGCQDCQFSQASLNNLPYPLNGLDN